MNTKLTKQQAFWGFVWGMFVVFVICPWVISRGITLLEMIVSGFIVIVAGLLWCWNHGAHTREYDHQFTYKAAEEKKAAESENKIENAIRHKRPNAQTELERERKRNFGFK
jgi:hypothetical protein